MNVFFTIENLMILYIQNNKRQHKHADTSRQNNQNNLIIKNEFEEALMH